ncbi:MAG: response regulator [Cytophagales bacterium]|nr:response regulator [Cytophagales bacterium]
MSDISIPVISGIELTKTISKNYPLTKVLILSIHNKGEYVIKAIDTGTSGYLSKILIKKN